MFKEKLKPKKFNRIDVKKGINQKYLRNGSYSMVISVIFLIIIIVINLIVGELPSKYTEIDISDEKIYSIGEQTIEMLRELEKDVTIYHIAQEGAEDEVISSLLKKYEDESKHIKIVKKDPVVNPTFVSGYTSDQIAENSLIVECGERSKIVDYNNFYETELDYYSYSYTTTGFDGEGQITSAIAYVVSENLPVIYTLEGHGELEISTTLQESIEKANMDIQTLNLLTEGSVPEDADCLMICSPTSDISEDEKEAILEYLENGGKAMIFSDYVESEMGNFDALLENYGVQRAEGIVFEGNSQYYAMQTPYYVVPDIGNAEAVEEAAESGYYVLAPFAQGILRTEDVRDTITIESLLTTSDSAYSKTNVNSNTMEKEDADIDGPFNLGVSITENVENDKTTQIVYYSTVNLMDDSVNQMVSGGNEILLMSSLKWMCDTEENTTVAIPSKNVEVSYLTLTDYDASFWKICVIGLVPGFFLVTGFWVWLKRRKA